MGLYRYVAPKRRNRCPLQISAHNATRTVGRVLVDKMKNTGHTVHDIADAHVLDLGSQLRLNGYTNSLGVMYGTGLRHSSKLFGDMCEQGD